MTAGIGPSFWAAVTTILAAFGVSYVPSDTVKAVIAAAAGLVIAVWQWQHHRTIRSTNDAAAAIATARADEAKHKAAAVQVVDHAAAIATARRDGQMKAAAALDDTGGAPVHTIVGSTPAKHTA